MYTEDGDTFTTYDIFIELNFAGPTQIARMVGKYNRNQSGRNHPTYEIIQKFKIVNA
jgi:hypothetical protein